MSCYFPVSANWHRLMPCILQILERDVFDSVEGRLMHVHRTAGKEKASVADFFNDAIDAREEGIIVKSAVSQYQVSDSLYPSILLSQSLVRAIVRTEAHAPSHSCAWVRIRY